MAFHDIRFPDDLSYGSRGGPGFKTNIIVTDSGQEERVARWSEARRQFDASYAIKSMAALATLQSFAVAREGAANSFRYKDWNDFTSASDHRSAPSNVDCDLGVGNGSQTQFQLQKKYVSGPITRTRILTKPVTGTVVVAIDSVNQSSGWTVNTTTGIITFTTAPTSGQVVSAGCEFDNQVRFGEEVDNVLSVSQDFFDTGSIDSIPLLEVISEIETYDEFPFGGAIDWGSITADLSLSIQSGRLQVFSPSTGLKLILPNPTTGNMTPGGPYFVLRNGGSNSIQLVTHAGAVIQVIAAGSFTTVMLGYDSGGTKTWYSYD